jgi:ABC-type multidrug transport system fused ATPase/permease subunit
MAMVVFALFALAYGGIFVASRRYLRRVGREAVAAGAARLTAVNEALGGFKDLKVSGREAAAFARYEAPSRRYAEVQAAVMAIAGLPRYALEAVAVGGMVIVASLMAGREGSFADTLPLLGAYAFAGLRLMPAMQNLFNALARLRFVRGSLEDELRDARDEEPLAEAPEPLPFADTLTLRGVTFAYPGTDAPTLRDLDLTLHRRRSLAIVGRTGSGKSTLVDVLLGLLEPASGVLEVDGVAVRPEQRRAYRRLFGYVPQSIYLLDDTIERNVAFGMPDAAIDAAAVRRACALAQIGEFIERELPDGYATVVGERGVRLSGGQRQRIGIARALYHGPEVLVFDEATSALDVHTERQVYQALEGLARTHTVVTIAHRLETVANVDRVVVLDGGEVVDAGPPGEVLRRYGAAAGAGRA